MTSVVANKIGLDIVDIQISQTGSAETDMFFQEPVLDRKKDYVVGVSELSIPFAMESPLTKTEQNLTESFIQLKRKFNPLNVHNRITYNGVLAPIDDAYAHFTLKNRVIVSPVDLVRQLHEWFETVSGAMAADLILNNQPGLPDQLEIPKVRFKVSPSGVVEIGANANFWHFFWFELSSYAQQLLGYGPYINFCFNLQGGVTTKSWELEDQVWTAANMPNTGLYDRENYFKPNNHPNINNQWREIRFNHSIYRYLDQRLRVELDADLAIPANILVENGNQKMHYNIASFAIPHTYSAQINVTKGFVESEVMQSAHMYLGNTIIKPKESPTTDWYKLVSAANVQNMRLHVFVVRRDWDPLKKLWSLVRNKLTLQKDMTWFATMKFIQQF